MSPTPRRRNLAPLVFATAFAAGCGFGGTRIADEGDGPEVSLPVTLSNHTTGAITIKSPEDPASCPSCEVTPSQLYRTVHLTARNGQTFTFKAEFGGVLRDQVTCRYKGESAVSVDWFEDHLRCVVWSSS